MVDAGLGWVHEVDIIIVWQPSICIAKGKLQILNISQRTNNLGTYPGIVIAKPLVNGDRFFFLDPAFEK